MVDKTSKIRTSEAFSAAPSLRPLVTGHMLKQDKSHYTYSKRFFALYDGGLLAYYAHERKFEEDVRKNKGKVRPTVKLYTTVKSFNSLW